MVGGVPGGTPRGRAHALVQAPPPVRAAPLRDRLGAGRLTSARRRRRRRPTSEAGGGGARPPLCAATPEALGSSLEGRGLRGRRLPRSARPAVAAGAWPPSGTRPCVGPRGPHRVRAPASVRAQSARGAAHELGPAVPTAVSAESPARAARCFPTSASAPSAFAAELGERGGRGAGGAGTPGLATRRWVSWPRRRQGPRPRGPRCRGAGLSFRSESGREAGRASRRSPGRPAFGARRQLCALPLRPRGRPGGRGASACRAGALG